MTTTQINTDWASVGSGWWHHDDVGRIDASRPGYHGYAYSPDDRVYLHVCAMRDFDETVEYVECCASRAARGLSMHPPADALMAGHQQIPRCSRAGCAGRGPKGPTGAPRPVYADGLCFAHYQASRYIHPTATPKEPQ